MPRLRRADPDSPGIARIRRGRGFTFRSPGGTTLPRGPERDRVLALAVPPAWTDVWIASHANDHIQATGTDEAGRRQYIYHPAWRERRDGEKFERMLALAQALPAARRRVTADLAADEPTRERVLAGTFRLLDLGSARLGADHYTDQHGSYGISTLLCSHATVHDGGTLELRFPGKSGRAWHLEVTDVPLATLVAALKRRGGRSRLFAWRDDDARWHPLRPDEINAYVREQTRCESTAKDFRTLAGTGAAALSLARAGDVEGEAAKRRAIAAAMRDAAATLSNTPAIARASYVDPRVVDLFVKGVTIDATGARSVETELLSLLGG